jgi:hypothetical protein
MKLINRKQLILAGILLIFAFLTAGCIAKAEESLLESSISEIAANENITDGADDKTGETAEAEVEQNTPEESTEDINAESGLKDGFIFAYNGVNVYLDEYTGRIVSELGEANDYYEVESCTFDGIAKTYSYNGFDVSTYQKSNSDADRVYSVDFFDDSVTTAEGVYIGQTFEDMVAAYGEEYTEVEGVKGFYSYEKNGTVLSFHLPDGIITAVSYKVSDVYE